MRGRKSVYFLLLFLFGAGSPLVVPGPVYAYKYECCMCMACSHIVCHYCMGESTTCGYCNQSESDSLEATTLADEPLDMRAVRKSARATVWGSEFVENFLIRLAGDPVRRNLLLTLAKHPDYKLTLWCPGSEAKHASNPELASQMKTEHNE